MRMVSVVRKLYRQISRFFKRQPSSINLSPQALHIIDNPGAWYIRAYNLKLAADEICWLDDNHEERRHSHHLGNALVFLIPMYRLLLGFAFENLLKGILVAQDVALIKDGKPNRKVFTHDIKKLIKQIDKTKFNLKKEEVELLRELEEYVIWRGRYPLPIDFEMSQDPGHGNSIHRREQELWNKMFSYLEQIGWMNSAHGTGKRIPLNRE